MRISPRYKWHLKGQLWLDAETHPTIHFKSTKVTQTEEGQYLIESDFTIKGITNKVSFPIDVQGPFKDPTQNITLGLKAEFTIDRFDYGLQFNKTMDNGELFIGREVKIKIRALAIEKSPTDGRHLGDAFRLAWSCLPSSLETPVAFPDINQIKADLKGGIWLAIISVC
ncbi:MAG: YceI family protein [Bacteroidota bacterium]